MQAPIIRVSSKTVIEADKSGFSRITKSGAYIGVITLAKAEASSTKTMGIKFNFDGDEGKAEGMTLWIQKADGSVINGFMGIIEGIATVLRQREIAPAQAMIKEYDYQEGCEIQKSAYVYQGLMNKRIGLILQAEEYENSNGDTKIKMNIIGSFDPETRMTPSEILEKAAEPKKLEQKLAYLKDKKLTRQTQQQSPTSSSKFEDFEDEIPF